MNCEDKLTMALDKKQKKQIEVIRKKIAGLQQQLAGEKQQMDYPAAVKRLEDEIAKLSTQRKEIEGTK